jgi:phage terminase large subunit-like protein
LSGGSALSKALDLIERQINPDPRVWHRIARPKQLPPDHERHRMPDSNGYRCGCTEIDHQFTIWLVCAGRGLGKSMLGSNWLVEQALEQPGSEWAVFAPTFRDTRKNCIEGSTGILAAMQPGELQQYRRNELQVRLNNGSVIYGYSADQPERIRGANLYGAWCDELATWRYPQTWYEGLIPALRKGQNPRVVVTTTPRPTKLLKDLLSRKDGSVHLTRGSTWENKANLSRVALAELRARYEGTRIGRQELEGELVEDVEGAIWSRDQIEQDRVGYDGVPDLTRVVVAIDPAVTSEASSDETGIVVAGEASGGHGYVLGDYSMRGTPDACMRKAVEVYHRHNADCIVAEVNNGGDFVKSLLRTVDPQVPYRSVRASRGKAVRAQPVAALYEQHRVHHVGVFAELEDQLTSWLPEDSSSPDRLDACVWAITELRGLSSGSWSSAYGTTRCPECSKSFIAGDRENCPFCGLQL